MADLFLHSRRLRSIFELLGSHENDITYSMGWALSQSPVFLKAVVSTIFPKGTSQPIQEIRLQDYHRNHGITDVEIIGHDLHAIIEAKRGWNLPGDSQLRQYVTRLLKSRKQHSALVVMSECSREYAKLHLRSSIGGFPVLHLSWSNVDRLATTSEGSHAEKRLLGEFHIYLRRIVSMQNHESNWVYVLSLGDGTPSWSKISWRNIVNKARHYFHPYDKNWPKSPPNYLAFRYDGRLQSIHHVESWKVVQDLHEDIPEIESRRWGPFALYNLGTPIVPPNTVRSGAVVRSCRVWAMLDLLLTSDTISEARDLTNKRLSQLK